ncbi:MAG: hypothetical protein NTZ05_23490 [Chloroflexi bacterium]|nr:hypothetical protein [Chloroflexota bacterium]
MALIKAVAYGLFLGLFWTYGAWMRGYGWSYSVAGIAVTTPFVAVLIVYVPRLQDWIAKRLRTLVSGNPAG